MEHALQLSSERINQDYLAEIKFPADLQVGKEIGPAFMEQIMFSLPVPPMPCGQPVSWRVFTHIVPS